MARHIRVTSRRPSNPPRLVRPRSGSRAAFALLLAAAACGSAGCQGVARPTLWREAGGNAALFRQFAAYDGRSGAPLSFAGVVARCSAADVVLFGEQHSNAICNQIEAQLLHGLAQNDRPVALAMEFFETDTQPTLDAYLAGRVSESEFRKAARQNQAYLLAHRPLIEYCRAGAIPVIAANAPRRMLRAFRSAGGDYDAFRETLGTADRGLVPSQFRYVAGGYRERFAEVMKTHAGVGPSPASAPASAAASAAAAGAPGDDAEARLERGYRAQLLWDNTMSDSLVRYRRLHPQERVMLIVGCFHVERNGATQQLIRKRRPHDRVRSITYRAAEDANLAFRREDRGAADIVIYGVTIPDEDEGMPPPGPSSAPASAPASAP